ncbi:MAG: hypothetical protein IJL02_04335 [Methanobrevibacter sp.]|uniref:DUF6110 family protein n=1 Tax=Methanobrevibacter sp. TaxID=66852 RepID=UPI0025F7F27D|nr:DUF6110 family protein [Methanobrevibacter sp.]MBQ6099074.1 hypothetical protein [Methanobrevibacter sp.]
MVNKEILDKCVEHKHALIFAAGIATAIVGKKLLESKAVKDAATQGMASVMTIRKDAEETFQDMREEAEEIVMDANEETKKEIYVEAKD